MANDLRPVNGDIDNSGAGPALSLRT